MYNLRRIVISVIGFFLVSGYQSAVPAGAENFAGLWHLQFYGKCVMTADNLQACRALQGPAVFAAMYVRGASLVVRGTGDYFSDARGHYRVRFSTSITERVPHTGAPKQCNNATVFDGTFTGTCREQGTGHGHIAPGRTGMPDFWQDDTAGTWNGRPAARFATSGPTDTFNPACADTFDTRAFMRLFGFRTVPAGIEARVVLTHKR